VQDDIHAHRKSWRSQHRHLACDVLVTQVRCQAVRWVSDDPQPGVVEVQLTDADGAVWSFVEKFYVFDADDDVWFGAVYPFEVELGCEIVSRHVDASGRDLVTISTRPSYVETEAGRDLFTVTPSQLV
jgi:hypothetical protein